MTLECRKEMVEHGSEALSRKRKCKLLSVPRSSTYYKSKAKGNDDVQVMNEMRNIYLETPFYGYRKMTIALWSRGIKINKKRAQRLMLLAGLKAIYPAKITTIRNHEHKIYPYLLRDLKIERPNQAWQVDITYIKMQQGFVYLICLIDVFSRQIMGLALSTFLDTQSCLEALNNALQHYEKPEIINSDQGSQFTSIVWTDTLKGHGIKISMDGKGRWVDNVYVERLWRTVKYESVFLHSYASVDEARISLKKFIEFYNNKRFHQSLNYHTPATVYVLKRVPTKKELLHSLYHSYMLQNQEVTPVS